MTVSRLALRARMSAAAPVRRHPMRRWTAAALLALALFALTARAETGDKEKPINYSADVGDVNYQTKVGTLTGNVIITQGTLTIHADKVVLKQNPDNSMSASAFGNPVTFRQKRDGLDEYFEGYAQRAEYDGSKQFLELFDRALLRRGQDEIRSNYITYNAATEMFKAEGRAASPAAPTEGGPGARVRGVFQPKSDSPPAKGAKDATPEGGKATAPDGGKATAPDTGKNAPKVAAPAGAPLTLKPAGELAPPVSK
jgi:lipopolysaccharide export system protein LptA